MHLIIETSTGAGAVGLWRPGHGLAASREWESLHNHTAELMPAVRALVEEAGGTERLTGIGAATGPGGFSALRAGLGVAKGLAFASGLPLVGVSTLEATAYPHRGSGAVVCAVIVAGRALAGWAMFDARGGGWRRLSDDRVTDIDELAASLRGEMLLAGEGAAAWAERLIAENGEARLAEERQPASRLCGAGALTAERLERGERDAPAGLAPHYARPPGIGTPKPPARVGRGRAARG